MNKEIAIGLVVICFIVIPLAIAMPVFLCELHLWIEKKRISREEREWEELDVALAASRSEAQPPQSYDEVKSSVRKILYNNGITKPSASLLDELTVEWAGAPAAGLMPSCTVCGAIMRGVCPECNNTTGISGAAGSAEREWLKGHESAIASTLKFVDDCVNPRRCDEESVDACVRCNFVYLASRMKVALAGTQGAKERE